MHEYYLLLTRNVAFACILGQSYIIRRSEIPNDTKHNDNEQSTMRMNTLWILHTTYIMLMLGESESQNNPPSLKSKQCRENRRAETVNSFDDLQVVSVTSYKYSTHTRYSVETMSGTQVLVVL